MTPLTWLYAPGARPELMTKALAADTDAVIFDLEDAVLPQAKTAARRAVLDVLDSRAAGPTSAPAIHVRVNPVSTDAGRADLRALAAHPAMAGIRLPKVDSPEEVALARDIIGPAGPTLHCLVESARGVERAASIAAAPRVGGISLGEGDLAAELGIADEDALAWARGRVVIAAAAAGLPAPSMSVYIAVHDDSGLAASCERGRRVGMWGRAAIHPRQLPIIRQAFAPAAADLARARAVLEAADRAEVAGQGAFLLPDGRFVDRAVVAAARRLATLAERDVDPAPVAKQPS